VAVEYILRTPLGATVSEMLESADLVAPELLDAEVLSVLRGAVLRGRLAEARARLAVDDLVHWPLERIPHRTLVSAAWQYHQNLSAYHALYVAAARTLNIPLLTTDGRLARAPGLGIAVQYVRVG
jgi:predicted nucleic acid-binding protein